MIAQGNTVAVKKERLEWIDFAKGVTILLMILGHCPIPETLREIIFSFHMPLFFVINGYFIKKYNIKKTFFKSVNSLLKPYVIICLIQAFLYMFARRGELPGAELFLIKIKAMLGGMSKISTHFQSFESVWLIWFICCLFFARNIYVLLRSVLKEQPLWLQYLILMFFVATGFYIGRYFAFLPWSLDVAFVALAFVLAGDILSEYKWIEKNTIAVTLMAAVVWIACLSQGIYIELATRSYPYFPVCIIEAIAGSICVLGICKLISQFKILTKIFSWYGKHSMLILGVHCLELMYFKWDVWVYPYLPFMMNGGRIFVVKAVVITIVAACTIQFQKGVRLLSVAVQERYGERENSREDWADVAKGIGIISVILGHLGLSYINRVVFTYHLPVFFVLSGYFLKKRTDKECAVTKGRSLLIPYAFTCILICVGAVLRNWILGWPGKKETFFSWAYASFYGAGDSWKEPFEIKGIGAIWFLLALFFAVMIVNHFIEKKYAAIYICAIAYIGWATFNTANVWLPFSIQAGCLASLYVYLGWEARKNNIFSENNGGVILLTTLLWLWSIKYFKGFWLVHNFLGNGWLDIITSLCGTYVIILISKCICEKYSIVKQLLAFYGRNSLIVLCFHVVELDLFSWGTVKGYLQLNMGFTVDESTIATFVFKLIWCTMMVFVVNYIPLLKNIFFQKKTKRIIEKASS